jgi:uncharacterized membrane protein
VIRLVFVLALLALPLRADVLPAFHAVTGVAADDVLNVRAAPAADAPVIGTLAPDAAGVEVIAILDGWAMVNAGEQTGFAAARFLRREPGPDWSELRAPLACFGTEPFWSLTLDPAGGQAGFQSIETTMTEVWQIARTWPGRPWAAAAAVSFPGRLAVLTPVECSDGMSDRSFGIGIDIFDTAPDRDRLSGCCMLVQP